MLSGCCQTGYVLSGCREESGRAMGKPPKRKLTEVMCRDAIVPADKLQILLWDDRVTASGLRGGVKTCLRRSTARAAPRTRCGCPTSRVRCWRGSLGPVRNSSFRRAGPTPAFRVGRPGDRLVKNSSVDARHARDMPHADVAPRRSRGHCNTGGRGGFRHLFTCLHMLCESRARQHADD